MYCFVVNQWNLSILLLREVDAGGVLKLMREVCWSWCGRCVEVDVACLLVPSPPTSPFLFCNLTHYSLLLSLVRISSTVVSVAEHPYQALQRALQGSDGLFNYFTLRSDLHHQMDRLRDQLAVKDAKIRDLRRHLDLPVRASNFRWLFLRWASFFCWHLVASIWAGCMCSVGVTSEGLSFCCIRHYNSCKFPLWRFGDVVVALQSCPVVAVCPVQLVVHSLTKNSAIPKNAQLWKMDVHCYGDQTVWL